MHEHGRRVAVVGCGWWGKNLVWNFHQRGRLCAVCDLDEARGKEMGKTYRVAVACEASRQDAALQRGRPQPGRGFERCRPSEVRIRPGTLGKFCRRGESS